MALFAISDLHLPLGVDKPMDIFGKAWEDYVNKLCDNWQKTVSKDDTVILPGDFSWATYLLDTKKDFDFLKSLNGKKILLKGNHDYWWGTMNKLLEFVLENDYSDIQFLQNNSFRYKDISICGTRGWTIPCESSKEDDIKIYKRELQRLELSLKSADLETEKIVFMHFPPITRDSMENEFTKLLKEYNVKKCIYGHLHANSIKNAVTGVVGGIEYLLVSCDYREFMPVKLSD